MHPTPPPHEGEISVMIYQNNTTLSKGEGRKRISATLPLLLVGEQKKNVHVYLEPFWS